MKYVLFVLMVVALSACGRAPDSDWDWYIVQSPLTGNCYEVRAINESGTSAEMAMAQVDCKFFQGMSK